MAHGKTINTLLAALLFMALSIWPDINPAGSVQAADRQLDPSNHEILGVDVCNCGTHDIYSKFGPSIPVREDIHRLCYVSDRDDTLVIFSFRGSRCFRFQLMLQKKKFNRWHFCAETPVVSRDLSTESGIKLGIAKSQLKTILGYPHRESNRNLIYVYPGNAKISAEFSPR